MSGQRIGQLRVAMARRGGGAGSGPGAPAVPTLTAPAGGSTVFPGIAFTVSATTTDTDLTKMEWLLDGAVVATVVGVGTPAGTFSTTCTLTVPTNISVANLNTARTLIARATRGSTTDSASISVTVSSSFAAAATSLGDTVLAEWQSDLGVTLNAGAVSALADQGGGGNTLSQGTGVAQPVYTSADATLNNMPSMVFDGSNDVLAGTLDLPAPPITIYTVFQTVTYTVAEIYWGAGAGNQYSVFTNTGTPKLVMFNNAASPDNAGAVVGTWTRGIQLHTASTSDIFQLAATQVTGVNTGNVNPTAVYQWGKSTAAANFSNIRMAMQVITSGTMSGTNRGKLDGMVTALYGAGVAV